VLGARGHRTHFGGSRDPLYCAVFSLFPKTMRAKRGHLEDGGASLACEAETPSLIVFGNRENTGRQSGRPTKDFCVTP
jgi:hypothetical protein